ncbi:thiol-disulfide oxidoreductase LTO1 [Olea europaea subsp. europaea]|uniref:Thiol-disulfide oxidoreductase LTO1 n=1 Tax=Olea europaea subsp. europaea TaxID=158383 RepID=A0A8S0QGQ7_OLEEU|nr:thiol-disulfide oxidoreductase LTO1 [Olea europaea subsp. europaea]
MTMMTSFISMSSLTFHTPFHGTPLLSHPPSLCATPFRPLLKTRRGVREFKLLRVNCLSDQSEDAAESKLETPSLSSSMIRDDYTENSAFKWCAALGGLGFLETSYLTYLKFTNSEAFCPVGGTTCTTILNSDFSVVFGVPLPLVGMLAYGLVAILGLQLGANGKLLNIERSDAQMVLSGTTTAMGVASAYFLYILSTRFAGESCLYCLSSIALSFSLFFITIKSLGSQKIQKTVGLQLCIASLVVFALSRSYNAAEPASTRLSETEIPYFTTEVKTKSSPLAISLARHLHSIGAKLYGAFWCSHCFEQKEMFGHEAAKLLDYVECFPDGVREGTKIAEACTEVKIEGFPTWVINGQVLSEEKGFSELAQLSGINLEDLSQSK